MIHICLLRSKSSWDWFSTFGRTTFQDDRSRLGCEQVYVPAARNKGTRRERYPSPNRSMKGASKVMYLPVSQDEACTWKDHDNNGSIAALSAGMAGAAWYPLFTNLGRWKLSRHDAQVRTWKNIWRYSSTQLFLPTWSQWCPLCHTGETSVYQSFPDDVHVRTRKKRHSSTISVAQLLQQGWEQRGAHCVTQETSVDWSKSFPDTTMSASTQ